MRGDIGIQPDDLQPHNLELEQALIGAILVNNEAYTMVASIVEPGHFYEPLHQRIFALCGERISSGELVTPVTLAHEWGSSDKVQDIDLKDADGNEITLNRYVALLAASATTIVNSEHYARQLVRLSQRRAVMDTAERLHRSIKGISGEGPGDLIGQSIDFLLQESGVDMGGIQQTQFSSQQIGSSIVSRLNKAFQTGLPQKTIVKSGIEDFDRQLGGGFQPGKLIIGGGRPGMGKTATASSIARRTAARGEGVAYFSLEMTAEELYERVLCDQAYGHSVKVPYSQIHSDQVDERSLAAICQAQETLERMPLVIEEQSGLTVARVRAQVQQLKRRMESQGKKLQLVVIDYLQLLSAGDRYFGQRTQEISEITLQLKNMAKDLDVCVMALSQLSRNLEQRVDKRPMLSDLRESGSIEQDADVVFFVYREYYYVQKEIEGMEQAGSDDSDPVYVELKQHLKQFVNKVELIFSKNRSGPTGTRLFFLDIACNAMRNLSDQHEGISEDRLEF